MLDAADMRAYEKGRKPAVRRQFNAAAAKDMAALGAAFARVVRRHSQGGKKNGVLRIGVHGKPEIGKTTFINGLLETIADKERRESPAFSRAQEQALWRSRSAGWIRHCDAGFGYKEGCLESYWNNDPLPRGAAFTDI